MQKSRSWPKQICQQYCSYPRISAPRAGMFGHLSRQTVRPTQANMSAVLTLSAGKRAPFPGCSRLCPGKASARPAPIGQQYCPYPRIRAARASPNRYATRPKGSARPGGSEAPAMGRGGRCPACRRADGLATGALLCRGLPYAGAFTDHRAPVPRAMPAEPARRRAPDQRRYCASPGR